jgi:beta-glucanase (GH16 family)
VLATLALAGALLPIEATALPSSANTSSATNQRTVLVRKRVRSAGVYVVRVAITARSLRGTVVDLKIGKLSRRATIRGRRPSARLRVKVAVRGRMLVIRATAKRGMPTLAVQVRRVGALVTSKHGSPTTKPGSGATTRASGPQTSPSATAPVAPAPSTAPVVPTAPAGTTGAAGPAGPPASPTAWNQVFDDEFNGSALDTTKWSTSWFNGGSMNNTSTSPANVSVSGGILTLTLSSTSVGALISTNPSGGASTGFQFTYGYTEARILFGGAGSTCNDWPAFWTDGQSWPQDGEIDIAEGLGTLTSNYHSNAGANNSNTVPGNWCGSWHTYGVDREPGINTIYWDGQAIRSYASNDGGSPQYLILNIGSGEGPSAAGDTMQVDYVRAWSH